jgi:hypothetical protein
MLVTDVVSTEKPQVKVLKHIAEKILFKISDEVLKCLFPKPVNPPHVCTSNATEKCFSPVR